jgi:hypothetical protein
MKRTASVARCVSSVWPAAALSIAAIMTALSSHPTWAAGAAYQVDTADVSEPGACKVESWISSAANRDLVAAVAPACVVDVFRPVEVSAQFERTRSDGEWGTSVAPKLKTNIIPTAIGHVGVAITTNAVVDLLTGDTTAWQVTVPATLRLSNVVRINLNAGYQRDVATAHHYFTYGAGFDWRTPDNIWTLTGEVFGQAGAIDDDTPRSAVRPRGQVGLRWRPIDEFNIDLIYGRNITGENANWITLATTVRFKVGP